MSSAPNRSVVSLWDMVANLSLSAVVRLLQEVNVFITLARGNRDNEFARDKLGITEPDPKQEEAMRSAVEGLDYIQKTTANLQELLKSRHVTYALERLQHWADDESRTWADLFTRSCALRDAIEIEFKDCLFYAYPRDKGQKFSAWADDWSKIVDAFPDTREESFAATDCYALGYNTASVFHSMRVAEIGLRALANERRVKLPKKKAIEWANWQEIIRALDEEIKIIGLNWKAGSRKDAALEFYSGARADLNGFKDEYRNLVMHLRVPYDEFQAARALSRVHDFMARLSAKIDHKHERIKWTAKG